MDLFYMSVVRCLFKSLNETEKIGRIILLLSYGK